MTEPQVGWQGYRLFPYETVLAERELVALQGASRDESEERLLERATYFRHVVVGGEERPTRQGLAESAHLTLRAISRPHQATRYGPHGLHEYKGKFNPQLARALVNVVDPDADVLIDPFCGSGTSLVEGLRLGLDVAGLDLSPLAVFIASTKTAVMRASNPRSVAESLAELSEGSAAEAKWRQDEVVERPVDHLAEPAVEYLRRWFTPPAFAALSALLVRTRGGALHQRLARVALSSVLREVSLQLPEDLRVRRRPPDFVAPPVHEHFGAAIERVLLALEELGSWAQVTSRCMVRHGDARHAPSISAVLPRHGRRLIVTSPPYATALPYIDTDRLSVIALGLGQPAGLRQMEAGLTGSRDLGTKQLRGWSAALATDPHGLPDDAVKLLRHIAEKNDRQEAGFRRAAVPALLYRYFCEMREALSAWSHVLRSGDAAVVVVGTNRTGPADDQHVIPTPSLLGACAEQTGFVVQERIPLQTWARYGMHAANAVRSEDALVLRRE